MSLCDLEPTAHGDLLCEACHGNRAAEVFLAIWNKVVHEIDDEIDDDLHSPSRKLRTMVHLNILYSTDFYRIYAPQLKIIVALVTSAYDDSVAWEKSVHEPEHRMADVLRFSGNEMVLAVAYITGGYERMRKLSPRLRLASWAAHHAESGKPV